MKKNTLIILLTITNVLTFVFAYTQRKESQLLRLEIIENKLKSEEIQNQAYEAKRLAEEVIFRTQQELEIALVEVKKHRDAAITTK